MADTYANYAELSASETEGVDYQIRYEDRGSRIIVIAIHGGGIERGSTEVAEKLASDNSYNFYTFEGLKVSGNSVLHITSTNFDEPTAVSMVANSDYCLAMHGRAGTSEYTGMGGLDLVGVMLMGSVFTANGHSLASDLLYPGTDPTNISNTCISKKGLQFEISKAQRDLMVIQENPGGYVAEIAQYVTWIENMLTARNISESKLNKTSINYFLESRL